MVNGQVSRLLATALLVSCAVGVRAQGGGGPPAGFQPPPEMMKKMQAWQAWSKSHKNIAALQQTLRSLGELDEEPQTRLTKAQATKILPVLKSWRTKPTMSDEQARQVNKLLTGSLTIPQIKRLASSRATPGGGRMGGPMGGGPGGGPPMGGGGRPGGSGGPGGGGPPDFSTFPDPKDFNPLNPETLPFAPMRPRARQQIDRLIQTVKARVAAAA